MNCRSLARITMVVVVLFVIIMFNLLIPLLVPLNHVMEGRVSSRDAIAIICWSLSWLVLPFVAWGIAHLVAWLRDDEFEVGGIEDWLIERFENAKEGKK